MVAARYSLVGLIGAGAGGTAATPNYSDISFNVDFGDGKLGNLSLFGILGDSDIEFLGDDIDEDDLFAAEDENAFVESGFGVVGLKHRINIGKKSYLKSIASLSTSTNTFKADRFIDKDTPDERVIRYTDVDDTQNRFALSTLFNTKLNRKVTLRAGVVYENFGIESLLRDRT